MQDLSKVKIVLSAELGRDECNAVLLPYVVKVGTNRKRQEKIQTNDMFKPPWGMALPQCRPTRPSLAMWEVPPLVQPRLSTAASLSTTSWMRPPPVALP